MGKLIRQEEWSQIERSIVFTHDKPSKLNLGATAL